MPKRVVILFLILLSGVLNSRAQWDSIMNVVQHMPNDSAKVDTLFELANRMVLSNIDLTETVAMEAKLLADELGYKRGYANATNALAIAHYYKGHYSKAMELYVEAMEVRRELGETELVRQSRHNIALLYYSMADYKIALEWLQELFEEFEGEGNRKSAANIMNDIGSIYFELQEYDKAEASFLKCLELQKDFNDPRLLIAPLHNLGTIEMERRNYEKARKYLIEAMNIEDKYGRREGMAESYNTLGELYTNMGLLSEAENYLQKGLLLAKELGTPERELESLKYFVKLSEVSGDYKSALNYLRQYNALSDSVFTLKKTEQIAEMQAKYETNSKIQENKFLRTQNKWFKIGATIISIALLVLIVMAILLYRNIRLQRYINKLLADQNHQIKEKNAEILAQSEQLAEANKLIVEQRDDIVYQHNQIRESISYASRIQSAVLPELSTLSRVAQDDFILWKPKDVVSGDFYWIREVGNQLMIAVADCTGHGVPGAFVSMLGISLLNEIVMRREVTTANQVLEEMRSHVKTSLHQRGISQEQKDGMDMAFCVINTNNLLMQYAGANNSIYLIRNDELKEYKPTKNPIGIHVKEQPFANQYIQLQAEDQLYLFSDGYADQLGGPKTKKFMRRRFADLLLSNHDLPMNEQRAALEKAHHEWRGFREQLDDIIILGIRMKRPSYDTKASLGLG